MSEQKKSAAGNPFVDWINSFFQAGDAFQAQHSNNRAWEFYEQWQDMVRKMIDETVRSDWFLKTVGSLLTGNSNVLSQLRRWNEQLLHSMGMPSAEEFKDLSSRTRDLDDRVENIEEKLEEILALLARSEQNIAETEKVDE